MSHTVVTDDLWSLIEPLLPAWPAQPKGGTKPCSDRAALEGILFVLRNGLAWNALPTELGYGSGVTCWRRLRRWQDEGVWETLHLLLLDELNGKGAVDWSRAAVDSTSVAAKRGASASGPARPTVVGRAPSVTCSSTGTVFPSPLC